MGRDAGVRGAAVALFVVIVLTAALAHGSEQRPRVLVATPPPGSIAVDGSINELAGYGDRVFVRGHFHQIGEFNGSSLGLDPATGERLDGFPMTDGQVSDVIADSNGGWYIAGSFSFVGGIERRLVAHVNADGTVDESFAPTVSGNDADALALVGDTLYVGGQLSSGSQHNLLALDADSGEITQSVQGVAGRVTELAYAPAGPGHSERLIVGIYPDNHSTVFLKAIDPATGMDIAGFSQGGVLDVGVIIRALAVDGNTLYVGGYGLVALHLGTGAPIPSFEPGKPDDGVVHTLLVDGDRLLAGGNFDELGGEPGPLVSLDPATGEADPAFDSPLQARRNGGGPDSGVFDLALTPGHLWAGGSFAGAASSPEPRSLLALDPDTGAALGPPPLQLNAQVNAVAAEDGRMYVGGWFYLVNPHHASGLASLDAKTLAVTDEVTKPPRGARFGGVMLPATDRILFAPTNFHGYDKPPDAPWQPWSVNVQAIDTASGEDLRDYGIGRVKNLTGIAIGDDHVYVAQRLENDVRFPHNRISVRSLETGKEIDSFRLPLRGYVTKLDFGDDALFAAGSFRRFRADATPAHLAVIKVDPRDGSLARRFDPHVDGPVYDIDVDGRRVYSVGLFTKAGPRIKPTRHSPGTRALKRRGLEAAATASGRPVEAFDPRGSWRWDLLRIHAAGDCLFIKSSNFGQLLPTGGPGSCSSEGVPGYALDATPSAGRIAYTDKRWGVAEVPELYYVALSTSP